MEMHSIGGCNPEARPQEMRTGKDERRRNKVSVQQILPAVEIGKHGVKQSRSLGDCLLDGGPFLTLDNERNWIHRPRVFIPRGQSSDVVCDSLSLNQLLAAQPSAAQLAKTHVPDFNH